MCIERTRRLHCLFLWVTCIFVSALSAGEVFRDGFETGSADNPARWSFVRHRGECAGSWDLSEPPPGGRSVRLSIATDETARATWACSERISVKPSTGYCLSVRIMRAVEGRDAKVYLIAYENGVESPDRWHLTPYLSGRRDWHTYEIKFKTRPDAEWLKLQCKFWYGTGYAWFDDVVLRELESGERVDKRSGAWDVTDDGSDLQLMWHPAHRRPDKTLCLLEGALNPVAMFFWGAKEKIARPRLCLETPEGIRVAGPVVHGRAEMPKPLDAEPKPVERSGRKLLRWQSPIRRETLVARLKPDGPVWTEYHFIYVEPNAACPRRFEWRWRLETETGAGPWHAIAARILPKHGGAVPPVPEFALYAQHTGALRHPDWVQRCRILDYLAYAGIRGGLSLTHYQPEYAHIDRQLAEFGFKTWAWNWNGYGGAGDAEQRLVYADGKTDRGRLCPQVQAERGEPFWSELVGLYRKRLAAGHKTLIINYEPPRFNCCFCPRCRAAFAGFAQLDPERVSRMTPQELQQLPDKQWARFRAQQNAAIVKNHIAAIHQVDAGVDVGICALGWSRGFVNEGMDISLFEPDLAFHAPMLYSVGADYARQVRESCENTRAPVIPFILGSDLVIPGRFPLPNDVRLELLATALSGGRGAVIWVGIESLDAEYANALRQALNEIRTFQGYVVSGSRADDVKVEAWNPLVRAVQVDGRTLEMPPTDSGPFVRWWAWRSPRGRVLGLINYDAGEAHRMRVSAPGIGGARSLVGAACRASGADEVVVELPSGEAAALRW